MYKGHYIYPPTNKNITQHQSAEARRLGSSKFQRSNISKNKQTNKQRNKIKQKPPTRSSSYNHIYIYILISCNITYRLTEFYLLIIYIYTHTHLITPDNYIPISDGQKFKNPVFFEKANWDRCWHWMASAHAPGSI